MPEKPDVRARSGVSGNRYAPMTRAREAAVRPWCTPGKPSIQLPPMSATVRALVFEGFVPLPRLGPRDWLGAANEIQELGLEGTALRVLSGADLVPLPQLLHSLRTMQFDRVLFSRVQSAAAAEITRDLESHGIMAAVMKGPSVARHYQIQLERTYSDVDILVPTSKFNAAMQRLSEAGYAERSGTEMPRRVLVRFGREATNLHTLEGRSVDVHHHISPWLWGRALSFDIILEGCTRSPDGWLEVSPVHNLLIVALHLVSDRGVPLKNLRCLRDAAMLLQHCEPRAVVREARRVRLGGWLHWVLGLLPEEVPGRDVLMSELADDAIPGAWRLRIMLSPTVVRRAGIEQLLRLPLAAWPVFVGSYMVPSHRYRRRRNGHE